MEDFRALKVWQEAHRLVLQVYQATATFPPDERFGLTPQLRRAAAQIPAAIAEGDGRGCEDAVGAIRRLDYFLTLAHDLELLDGLEHRKLEDQLVEVDRLLAALAGCLEPTGS